MIATQQPLSDTDRRTVYAILCLHEKNGCPPTTQELGDALGVTRKAAWDRIVRLRRKGVIELANPGQKRSLILVAERIAEEI